MKKGEFLLSFGTLFLGLLAGQALGVQSASHEFFLDFVDAYMVYDVGAGKLQIAAEGNVLNYGEFWTVLKVESNVFHLKHLWMRKGGGSYWKVYTASELRRACRVTGGTFGKSGGTETPLHCKVEVYGTSSSGSPDRFILRFVPESKAYLVFWQNGTITSSQIFAEDNTLSYGTDWDYTYKPAEMVYDLQQDRWKGFLWRVDLNQKKAWRVTGINKGGRGTLTPLKCSVRVIY